MTENRPILVAVDMPISERDLRPAMDLAEATGWTVHLLHAPPPEPDFVGYSETGGLGEVQFREKQLKEWDERLHELAADLTHSGVPCETHLTTGPVVDVILGVADEIDARIICLVGHKHNVAHRVFLGSVAASLLKVSDRPVLVLPPNDSSKGGSKGVEVAVDRLLDVIDRNERSPEDAPVGDLTELREAAQGWISQPDPAQHSGNRLREAVRRFETDHPSLTRAVNDVAYYLSGMGL